MGGLEEARCVIVISYCTPFDDRRSKKLLEAASALPEDERLELAWKERPKAER